MAWKLFGRSKSKDEDIVETEKPIDEVETYEEVTVETEEVQKEGSLAEHHETLKTGVATSKKSKTEDQSVWRDVNTIEEKIDNLHITRAKKPVNELDKTVDRVLEKQKKK